MDEQVWIDYENAVRDYLPEEVRNSATFFRDGIVAANKEDFLNSDFRPLFIMKEVHDEQGCDGCESEKKSYCVINHVHVEDAYSIHTDFVKCKDIQECVNIWFKVAALTKMLFILKEEPSKEYSGLNRDEAVGFIKKSAIVNLKKIGAGKVENSPESLNTLHYSCHVVKSRKYLQKQIADINPNLIICCGTIDALLQNHLCDVCNEPIHDFAQDNLRGLSKAYIGTIKKNPVIIIDMWHPSTSISYDAFLKGIKIVFDEQTDIRQHRTEKHVR